MIDVIIFTLLGLQLVMFGIQLYCGFRSHRNWVEFEFHLNNALKYEKEAVARLKFANELVEEVKKNETETED